MASAHADWFLPSNSTSDLCHSGLGYQVSGTSKSLEELFEMLPGGKGQNKINKERRAGEQDAQLKAGHPALAAQPHWSMSTAQSLVHGEQRPANGVMPQPTSQVGSGKWFPTWWPLLILYELKCEC